MKWFKHMADMLEETKLQMCLDKFGTKGPYAYVRLLEIFAKHFDPETPETFVESKRKIMVEIFPTCCQKTGKKILDYFHAVGLLKYMIRGREIIFRCQEMKELADEYTQKCMKEKKDKCRE